MKVKIIECLSKADLKAFKNLGLRIKSDLVDLGITTSHVNVAGAAAFVKEVKSVDDKEDVVIVAHADPDCFALPDGSRTLWLQFGALVGSTTLKDRRLFLAVCNGGTRTAPARLLFQAGRLQQAVGPFEKAHRRDVLIAVSAYFGGLHRNETLPAIVTAMNKGHSAMYRVYDRTGSATYAEHPQAMPQWIDKKVKRPVKKVKRKSP